MEYSSMVGATILDIAYGIEVLPANDPYIKTAEEALGSVGQAAFPGAYLVNILPILLYVPSWMPGAGFKRKAKEWRKLGEDVLEVPFRALKQTVVSISGPFTSM